MFVSFVQTGLVVAGVYLGLGFLIGTWLALTALHRLDPVAQGGSLGFKLLMIPGLTLFWPLFLYRLAKGINEAPDERNAHRRAAGGES